MQTGKVQTVRGDILPDELGITMTHEHLQMPPKFFWPWMVGENGKPHQDGLSFLIDATLHYARFGGKSLVGVSASNNQSDPRMLRQLSQETGINIVMSTGFYKEPLYRWSRSKLKTVFSFARREKP